MSYYAIATALSFVTACFTFASSWTKDPKRTYWYQVWQCLVYAVASYFFGVYPAIVTMIINATRNYLIATGKYKAGYAFLFSFLALVLGLRFNTSGLPGLLTVTATIQYSILSYYLRGGIPVKVNVTINQVIWMIYDLLILDVFSGIMDTIGAALAILTIFRIMKDRQQIQGAEQE